MSKKLMWKRGIDVLMMLALPVAMATRATGKDAHEWIAVTLVALFITHSMLNIGGKPILEEKYNLQRSLKMAVNLLMAVALAGVIIGGIMMSRQVFAFWHIESGMAFARRLHLAMSYWAFVLISMHIGFHINAVKLPKPVFAKIAVVAAAMLFSGYGLFEFVQQKFAGVMFFRQAYGVWDYEKSAILHVVAYLAIMYLWAGVAAVVMALTRRPEKREHSQEIGSGLDIAGLLRRSAPRNDEL
jgi:hypothetical protein